MFNTIGGTQMNQPSHVSRSGQNMMPMGQTMPSVGGMQAGGNMQQQKNLAFNGQMPLYGQMGNQSNMQQPQGNSQYYNH
jgi:hypothetical protein